MNRAHPALRNYERHPYPGSDPVGLSRRLSLIPPLSWINGLGRPGRTLPRRVLVAGCGTGMEVFALRRQLPHADIVGVDFSPRSIALARRAAARARLARPARFVVGDLTADDLPGRVGTGFDFISCHGVLTYLLRPGRVLRRLRDCLAGDGVIYLGVNGGVHPSVRLRPWLAGLGFDASGLGARERPLRRLLHCWDRLQPGGATPLAGLIAGYLASDVCGVHFNNWALSQWRAEANRAGLEVVGSVQLPHTLRRLVGARPAAPVFDRTIGALAALLDRADPAGFHRLLLRPGRPGDFDLTAGPGAASQVCWTGLYSLRPGRRDTAGRRIVALDSPAFRLALRWPLPERQARALHELARAGAAAGPSWRRNFGPGAAARGLLRLWQGLAILAPGGPAGTSA